MIKTFVINLLISFLDLFKKDEFNKGDIVLCLYKNEKIKGTIKSLSKADITIKNLNDGCLVILRENVIKKL